jgi:hypothetical protein
MNTETSVIQVNTGLLNALSKGNLNLDVFARELVALECYVAGTSFRKIDAIEPQLDKKVRLDMKREPKNEHNDFAIGLWFNDTKVGYLPRDKNETVARLMDGGKQFYATIQTREYEGNWLRLEIQVIMKD